MARVERQREFIAESADRRHRFLIFQYQQFNDATGFDGVDELPGLKWLETSERQKVTPVPGEPGAYDVNWLRTKIRVREVSSEGGTALC